MASETYNDQTLMNLTSSRTLDMKKTSYEFGYKSWEEFMNYSPWNSWFQFELCNYIWTTDNMLYLFFNCVKEPGDKRHFKVHVTANDETLVREWLKEHIPAIWRI